MFTSPSAPAAAQRMYWPKKLERSVNSTTKGESGASNSVLRLLQNKGWGTPDLQEEVQRKPSEVSDLERTSYLKPYAYALSEPEYERLTNMYEGMEGFTAPEPVMKLNAGSTLDIPQAVRDEAKRREGLLARPALMDPGLYQNAELSPDAYKKLSEQQKDRVDFNSLMVDAREADLAAKPTPSAEQKAQYDKDVEEMFGEHGGSVVYAPEVVNLLKQVDFQAVGQDLDEYLSLERLTDLEDLGGATYSAGAVKELKKGKYEPEQYAEARADSNLRTLDARTAEAAGDLIEELMTNPATGLQDFRTSVASARMPGVVAHGGAGMLAGQEFMPGFKPLTPGAEIDPNDTEGLRTGYYQMLYDLARDKGLDLEGWTQEGGLRDEGLQFSSDDYQDLMNYFDIRTRQEQRWGLKAPGEPDANLRTPEELRALFGLKE